MKSQLFIPGYRNNQGIEMMNGDETTMLEGNNLNRMFGMTLCVTIHSEVKS